MIYQEFILILWFQNKKDIECYGTKTDRLQHTK